MTDIRVCFLGDSFTLGTGDDTGLGWAGRVHAAARGRGVALSSYNLGIRGETGAEIARRIPEVAVRIADRGEKQGLVLSFGANDIRLGCTPDESAQAAAEVLTWAQGQGYQTFMMGCPHGAEPELDALRGELNLRLQQTAQGLGTPFLDIRTALADWTVWHREAMNGDGIHPNAEGYRAVSAIFCAWQPWRDWLDG
jgi:lysophospholipase L1-like esterase